MEQLRLMISWPTATIPLALGVNQGDPLSVVIFNMVINTMVDTLQTRSDLGFLLPNSHHQVSFMQYADDTCITVNSPAAGQQLLDMVDRWFQRSGMRARVPKCHCLVLQGSTGKVYDPHLSIANQTTPYIRSNSIRFLGMTIQVQADLSGTKRESVANLQRMLKAVDAAPVKHKQKLWLYKTEICPQLSWLLKIEELPFTWVEGQLETQPHCL